MDKQLIDYFIKETNSKFDKLDEKVDKNFKDVGEKIDLLFAFKWQIIGGSTAMGTLFGAIAAILTILIMQ